MEARNLWRELNPSLFCNPELKHEPLQSDVYYAFACITHDNNGLLESSTTKFKKSVDRQVDTLS